MPAKQAYRLDVIECIFGLWVGQVESLLQASGISKAQRILGIVVDNAVASYYVFVLGEGGGVIAPIPL